MFESLTERLSGVFGNLGRRGRLSESDVDAALREVRMALLEADVNFRVARDFVASVRERAVGREVTHSVTPAQQVTKIVHDNLVELLGGETARLATAPRPPSVVLMVGLQGSGKTTGAAKLALAFRKDGGRPLLVAADTYRPAAIAQLQTLGKQIEVPVHQQGTDPSPLQIAKRGLELGVSNAHSHVIVDTAGRLQLDDAMMDEVEQISRAVQPVETLFVADATTGQEAVNVAKAFHARTPLTGTDSDQDGRRRTRRGRPLDPGSDRDSGQVRGRRRARRAAGGLSSRPHRFPHPGHGRRGHAGGARRRGSSMSSAPRSCRPSSVKPPLDWTTFSSS